MKYWTMRKGNREIKVYQRWKVLLLKLVGWKFSDSKCYLRDSKTVVSTAQFEPKTKQGVIAWQRKRTQY